MWKIKGKAKHDRDGTRTVCALCVWVCVNTSTILCKEGFQFPLSGSALSVSHFAPQIINSISGPVSLAMDFHFHFHFQFQLPYRLQQHCTQWLGERGARNNSYTSSIHPSNNKRPATAPTSGQVSRRSPQGVQEEPRRSPGGAGAQESSI